jgi:hypothetical protein
MSSSLRWGGWRRFLTSMAAWAALTATRVLTGTSLAAEADADVRQGDRRQGDWRIVRTLMLPEVELSAGVVLGGLSDLALDPEQREPRQPVGDRPRFWSLTDRGPNGTVKVGGRKLRTLVAPEFVPTLLLIECGEQATVKRVVPLAGRSGTPLSGKPNAIGRDEAVLAADGTTPIDADPNGIDPEGLVPMADGTFWVAEEYRPSLLHLGADGRLIARYVPEGHALAGADGEIRPVLPAAYGLRRDNRGFEGLALAADGSRLWAILQSPLDGADEESAKQAKKTGNVRLLAFDPAAGRPVAEHVYRLGDPADPDYLSRGAPPKDGKLCAIAPVGADRLLVLEQDDTGLARLYLADLAAATDTLGWQLTGKGNDAATDTLIDTLIDTVRDLPAAGVAPVTKTLVADLTAARRLMWSDATEGLGGTGSGGDRKPAAESDSQAEGLLKLEGLAVLDDRHIALVNDNDFSVHDPTRPQRTCIWIVELAEPLSSH